jgi:hypothetical protein
VSRLPDNAGVFCYDSTFIKKSKELVGEINEKRLGAKQKGPQENIVPWHVNGKCS